MSDLNLELVKAANAAKTRAEYGSMDEWRRETSKATASLQESARLLPYYIAIAEAAAALIQSSGWPLSVPNFQGTLAADLEESLEVFGIVPAEGG